VGNGALTRCASGSRIIVFDAVYNRFRDMLIERTKQRLEGFGARAVPLQALADYVVERKN